MARLALLIRQVRSTHHASTTGCPGGYTSVWRRADRTWRRNRRRGILRLRVRQVGALYLRLSVDPWVSAGSTKVDKREP